MKTLAKIKRRSVLLGILFVMLLIGIVYAAEYYQVNSGATSTIDEWSVCKKVTNNNALGIFVPTKTEAEWTAFRTNVSGVTSAECCVCSTGPCCDGCNIMANGAQPTGYTDDTNGFCTGTNGSISTSYVYTRDYYCNGVDTSMHYTDTKKDTCGTCEYCTDNDLTCNYYSTATSCGTKDCDYLNSYFTLGTASPTGTNYCKYRNYSDKTRYCSSGTCDSPSCTSYSDSTVATCGLCKFAEGACSSCTNYTHTYTCGTCKYCLLGSCINVPPGTAGYGCTALHSRCDAWGDCSAPLETACIVGNPNSHCSYWCPYMTGLDCYRGCSVSNCDTYCADTCDEREVDYCHCRSYVYD